MVWPLIFLQNESVKIYIHKKPLKKNVCFFGLFNDYSKSYKMVRKPSLQSSFKRSVGNQVLGGLVKTPKNVEKKT